MYDIIEFVVIALLVLVAAAAAVCGISYGIGYIECQGFQNATGVETRMGGFSCYAQVDGKWVPMQYVFGDAKELRIK